MTRSRLAWLALGVALAALVVLGVSMRGGSANLASSTDPEARALHVERQLLCPQCTNQRLDTCEVAICHDMRREIRQRLEHGESEQQVVDFFAARYGDRILAVLPKAGFNLWLWGWVLLSMALVAVAGFAWLTRQRRRPSADPRHTPEPDDERWLDAQLLDEPAPGT